MKSLIIILSVLVSLSSNQLKAQNDEILKFYSNYSPFTDPGKYESMYINLPDSLPELCRLIKAQLIHPIVDLPKYRDLIPSERSYEDLKYPTVQKILAGLESYNPEGLVFERKPGERLVVSCRYHAILLASILKSRGIPARLRYGFASYIYPGYKLYHVVCELWNRNENRWILVDPDREIMDLNAQQFEFSGDVWLKFRQDKLDPSVYGVPNWWGAHPVLDVLCHDLASVLGNEYIYFDRPPISADSTMDVNKLSPEQLTLMDRVGELMKNVDNNLYELRDVYNKNKQLQFSGYVKEK